jgi:carboxylesterase type B
MRDFALSLDDDFYNAATDFWGFLFFGAPSYFIAKQHSLSSNPTYLYQFDKHPNIPKDYLGATHALELGYLFNKGGLFGIEGSYDDSDIKLAKIMRADWIQFAKTGMPHNANSFNSNKSNARIYDSVINDKTIEHVDFYKSYSTFWENLR